MKLIVSALICMNLCSCALIFQGSRQAVTINTTSDKARILVDGQQVGTGSCKVKLARKKDHTVIVKQDQCKTETVHIDSNVQPGWVIFDFFFNWGAFLTDPTTGAWNKLDKDNIFIDIQCELDQ